MTTDTTTVPFQDVRPDDVIRFRPLGYRIRLTVYVSKVRTMEGYGRIVDGYRARVERDGDHLVCITRGELTGWGISERTEIELVRRTAEV